MNIVLLDYTEQFPNSSEDHGSEVVEFEGLHFGLLAGVLSSLRQPVILPSALLLVLPVSKFLSRQLTNIV